ncbi:MAG: lipid-A-disaccharide synthase, partial [Candidatus Omnitrophica bacterium]|nr:lipid-A-disaccharide synthase [Candidatus Omnitrophota bacterium]
MDRNILIIAGEPSGDQRASELIKELKPLTPGFSFWGFGGDLLEKEGVELIEHVRDLSLVGVWEVIKNLGKIYAQYKHLVKNIDRRKPSLAILIDYPGFNLKIAKTLKKKNIPVIYYIIPQVWAWDKKRVYTLKKYTDEILVIFRFEQTFLKKYDVNCTFVGHPLVDTALKLKNLSVLGNETAQSNNKKLCLALLPGSRKHEIDYLLPTMLQAADNIHKEIPATTFMIAENSNLDKSLYDSCLDKYVSLPVERVRNNTFGVLEKCDFAVVASGTATL